MKEEPLVSIIVNNYNYGQFLNEAIRSALNQTHPRVEVVVVDDGSTDNSRQIIANYEDQIIPVLKNNGGQASACNAGFAVSQGEIVIFLDADDYLFPHAVERVVAAWNPDLVKVHFRLQQIDALGNPLDVYPPQRKSLDSGVVWPTLLHRARYVTPTMSGNSFSREMLNQLLPITEALWPLREADAYLQTSVPFHGRIGSVDEVLGAYRIHESNAWSLTTLSSDGFRTHLKQHIQRQALIVRKARELGYSVSPNLSLRDHEPWSVRIASLRLDPQNHPISSDKPLPLVRSGLRSIWKYSNFNWKQRLLLSLWFVWVGLLPLPMAKVAIAQKFLPRSRPRGVDWIIETFVRR